MNHARVLVSLVTYNGIRWLRACLQSVRDQRMADFRLVVMDNASTDGTVELLRRAAAADPRITLVESAENVGFAVGHNRSISGAGAEFVMLLNQDVELDPGFLEAAIAAFDGRPAVGAVQGLLYRLSADGRRSALIDSTGLQMHRDRRVIARRQAQRQRAHDLVAGPVWGVDGPAPVYRREALLAAREPRTGGGWEILDEDFFMYKEDVDLAWRLRRLGWRSWYEPRALAWHARSAGAGRQGSWLDVARSNRSIAPWIKALSWRNHRLMQLKNEEPSEFCRDLPWILRRELLSLGFTIVFDPPRVPRMIRPLLSALPASARKRFGLRERDVPIPPGHAGRGA